MRVFRIASLALLLPAFAAQASFGNAPASDPAAAVPARVPAMEREGEAAKPAPTAVRRSRMVEAGADDRPVMNFAFLYRVVEKDDAGTDDCLQYTGTRLKRQAAGKQACAVGNGQVFVPDR